MSLESTLAKLIAAIEDNTKAIREATGTVTSAPAPAATTAEPPTTLSDQDEPTPERQSSLP